MTAETVKRHFPLEPTLGQDPLTHLTRSFVYFLQSFFEHQAFVGTGMHWNDNEDTTEMIITAEKPRQEALDKVPHIACVMGQMNWSSLGIDQMQSIEISTGKRSHTDLIPSTMTYHCMAKEGLHARRMAWYASWGTIAFRRMLMKAANIFHIQATPTVSGESPPSAYTGQLVTDEVINVAVTISFFFQYSWSLQPKPGSPAAMPLKDINLNLSVNDIAVQVKRRNIVQMRGRTYYSVPIGEPLPEASTVLQQTTVVTDD